MATRRAEAAAERGEFEGAQVLFAEHQHGVVGEGLHDKALVASSSGFDRSMPIASVPSVSPRGRSCGDVVMANLRGCWGL